MGPVRDDNAGIQGLATVGKIRKYCSRNPLELWLCKRDYPAGAWPLLAGWVRTVLGRGYFSPSLYLLVPYWPDPTGSQKAR